MGATDKEVFPARVPCGGAFRLDNARQLDKVQEIPRPPLPPLPRAPSSRQPWTPQSPGRLLSPHPILVQMAVGDGVAGRRVDRANGLDAPLSRQSRVAAALVLMLAYGVVDASRMPPKPSPDLASTALWAWRALAVVWVPLLAWLLISDPRARPPRAAKGCCGAEATRCRRGCIIAQGSRTKHCRKCNKCVDGFDHHCLWLNTCVGERNYRPWVAFVAALALWAAIGSGVSWVSFLRALTVKSRRFAVGQRPMALLTALGGAATTGWLLTLLAVHAFLTWRGISTLEWIKGSRPPVPQGRLRRLRSASRMDLETLRSRLNIEACSGRFLPWEVPSCHHQVALQPVPPLCASRWRRQLTFSSVETLEGENVPTEVLGP